MTLSQKGKDKNISGCLCKSDQKSEVVWTFGFGTKTHFETVCSDCSVYTSPCMNSESVLCSVKNAGLNAELTESSYAACFCRVPAQL